MATRRLLSPPLRLLAQRSISSLPSPTEVVVEVPWGKVAGVQWHLPHPKPEEQAAPAEPPVPRIALHGLMDNLGTFTRLLPGLPGGITVTALDLPGHGRSSPLHPGANYTWLETVETLHRVKESLGVERPVVLGHSMGGWLAGLYAAIFPDQVRAVVSLDGVKPVSRQPGDMVPRLRDYLRGKAAMEAAGERPSKPLGEEEMVERLYRGTNQLHGEGAITREGARCLVARGTTSTPGGVVLARDRRHALRDLPGLPHQYALQFAGAITCPHLLIRASAENAATTWGAERSAMEEVINIYRKNPKFRLVEVEGSHHVHLNHPEQVIPHIGGFARDFHLGGWPEEA